MAERITIGELIIAALVVGYILKPSPVTKYHLVELYCSSGLDQYNHCDSVVGVGSELSVSINTSSNVVELYVDKNDGQFFENSIYRNDCRILDKNNWMCSDWSKQNIPDAVVEQFGMDRGVYYRSVTGGPPPDSYASSISWYPYLLYKYKLFSLADAVWLSNSF